MVCVLTWFLLGVKKSVGYPRLVSFRGLIQNFRLASPPLSYADSPTHPPGVEPYEGLVYLMVKISQSD